MGKKIAETPETPEAPKLTRKPRRDIEKEGVDLPKELATVAAQRRRLMACAIMQESAAYEAAVKASKALTDALEACHD